MRLLKLVRDCGGLGVLSVASLLSGCATTAAVSTVPVELLRDCPVPQVSTRTNGELVVGILALRKALRECNDDKSALRFHYNIQDDLDSPQLQEFR